MMVNYPCNIDDSLTTTVGEPQLQHRQEQHQDQLFGFPTSTATSMSYFLHRLRLADLCRQVVDTLPSVLLEPQDLDYDIVLMLDSKFQSLIKSLPTFFQLDPNSIQESLEVCQARPYIAWQRATLHFSINTYTCRLHRPFHLEGTKNPKYAFSRMMCVRSAHAVLELWRSMADLGDGVGLNPARFWTVAQHVFLAAITLAAEHLQLRCRSTRERRLPRFARTRCYLRAGCSKICGTSRSWQGIGYKKAYRRCWRRYRKANSSHSSHQVLAGRQTYRL